MRRIESVFVYASGYVAVLDPSGQQIEELQGQWVDRHREILSAADFQTRFYQFQVLDELRADIVRQVRALRPTWLDRIRILVRSVFE